MVNIYTRKKRDKSVTLHRHPRESSVTTNSHGLQDDASKEVATPLTPSSPDLAKLDLGLTPGETGLEGF